MGEAGGGVQGYGRHVITTPKIDGTEEKGRVGVSKQDHHALNSMVGSSEAWREMRGKIMVGKKKKTIGVQKRYIQIKDGRGCTACTRTHGHS